MMNHKRALGTLEALVLAMGMPVFVSFVESRRSTSHITRFQMQDDLDYKSFLSKPNPKKVYPLDVLQDPEQNEFSQMPTPPSSSGRKKGMVMHARDKKGQLCAKLLDHGGAQIVDLDGKEVPAGTYHAEAVLTVVDETGGESHITVEMQSHMRTYRGRTTKPVYRMFHANSTEGRSVNDLGPQKEWRIREGMSLPNFWARLRQNLMENGKDLTSDWHCTAHNCQHFASYVLRAISAVPQCTTSFYNTVLMQDAKIMSSKLVASLFTGIASVVGKVMWKDYAMLSRLLQCVEAPGSVIDAFVGSKKESDRWQKALKWADEQNTWNAKEKIKAITITWEVARTFNKFATRQKADHERRLGEISAATEVSKYTTFDAAAYDVAFVGLK